MRECAGLSLEVLQWVKVIFKNLKLPQTIWILNRISLINLSFIMKTTISSSSVQWRFRMQKEDRDKDKKTSLTITVRSSYSSSLHRFKTRLRVIKLSKRNKAFKKNLMNKIEFVLLTSLLSPISHQPKEELKRERRPLRRLRRSGGLMKWESQSRVSLRSRKPDPSLTSLNNKSRSLKLRTSRKVRLEHKIIRGNNRATWMGIRRIKGFCKVTVTRIMKSPKRTSY